MSHGRTVCTHGALITQCRCIDHKNTTVVACPWPDAHGGYPTLDERPAAERETADQDDPNCRDGIAIGYSAAAERLRGLLAEVSAFPEPAAPTKAADAAKEATDVR